MAGIELAYLRRVMNKKTGNCQRLRLDPQFVFRGSVVGLMFSFSSLCLAATVGTDSVAPLPNAAVTAAPAASVDGSPPTRHTGALAPARYSECLQLLAGTDHVSPA